MKRLMIIGASLLAFATLLGAGALALYLHGDDKTAADGRLTPMSVHAIDADHAYAFLSTCKKDWDCHDLTARVGTRHANGWRWERAALPAGFVPPTEPVAPFLPQLFTIGERGLAIVQSAPRRGPSFLSDDYGRTWRKATSQTFDALPEAGGVIDCLALDGECQILAADPKTGAIGPLRTQPGLRTRTGATATGDSIWTVGPKAQHGGPLEVATSRDRGRTWTYYVLPSTSGAGTWDWELVAVDSARGYLAISNEKTVRFFTTADGGATWRSVGQPQPGLDPGPGGTPGFLSVRDPTRSA